MSNFIKEQFYIETLCVNSKRLQLSTVHITPNGNDLLFHIGSLHSKPHISLT